MDQAQVIFGNVDGLDYWNQTEDYLRPVLDKNNTYSTVIIFNRFLFQNIIIISVFIKKFTFTERTIDILQKHDKSKPFFIYFASQNAHLPNQVGFNDTSY